MKNTVIADYVWLPLRFEGEMVYIDWQCFTWRDKAGCNIDPALSLF